MNTVEILNVTLHNLTMKELLENLNVEKSHGELVVTPNVDHLVKLQNDPEFYQIYQEAEYVVCDSRIMMYAAEFLGTPIREKLSGSDVFPAFYRHYKDDENVKIFLLGAAPGVAKEAQKRINRKTGRNIVVDYYSPSFGFEKNEAECQKIVNLINQSGATVLAVGVGAPKQEKWIAKYREKLNNIKIFFAVGATLDFEAGNVERAPQWVSEVGLEWLYRLVSEPKRMWKRYLVDGMPFFWWVLQQKIKLYNFKKPIGLILKEAGLISKDEIEFILQEQAQNPQQKFGELAVEQGWLNQQTVEFFVKGLSDLTKKSQKTPIGEYLKAAGLLTDYQVASILDEQKQVHLKFGQIAVSKKWVKQETIDFFLQFCSAPKVVDIPDGSCCNIGLANA